MKITKISGIQSNLTVNQIPAFDPTFSLTAWAALPNVFFNPSMVRTPLFLIGLDLVFIDINLLIQKKKIGRK